MKQLLMGAAGGVAITLNIFAVQNDNTLSDGAQIAGVERHDVQDTRNGGLSEVLGSASDPSGFELALPDNTALTEPSLGASQADEWDAAWNQVQKKGLIDRQQAIGPFLDPDGESPVTEYTAVTNIGEFLDPENDYVTSDGSSVKNIGPFIDPDDIILTASFKATQNIGEPLDPDQQLPIQFDQKISKKGEFMDPDIPDTY